MIHRETNVFFPAFLHLVCFPLSPFPQDIFLFSLFLLLSFPFFSCPAPSSLNTPPPPPFSRSPFPKCQVMKVAMATKTSIEQVRFNPALSSHPAHACVPSSRHNYHSYYATIGQTWFSWSRSRGDRAPPMQKSSCSLSTRENSRNCPSRTPDTGSCNTFEKKASAIAVGGGLCVFDSRCPTNISISARLLHSGCLHTCAHRHKHFLYPHPFPQSEGTSQSGTQVCGWLK